MYVSTGFTPHAWTLLEPGGLSELVQQHPTGVSALWVHQIKKLKQFSSTSVAMVIQIPVLEWIVKICEPSPRLHRVKKKNLPSTIYDPPQNLRFPSDSDSKESASNVGDLDFIPRLGKSPGGGNGCSFRYSCLKNPMNRGAWWATAHGVTKSQIGLSD